MARWIALNSIPSTHWRFVLGLSQAVQQPHYRHHLHAALGVQRLRVIQMPVKGALPHTIGLGDAYLPPLGASQLLLQPEGALKAPLASLHALDGIDQPHRFSLWFIAQRHHAAADKFALAILSAYGDLWLFPIINRSCFPCLPSLRKAKRGLQTQRRPLPINFV